MVQEAQKKLEKKIIQLAGHSSVDDAFKGLLKSFLKEIKNKSKSERELADLVNIDGLTNLYNHKHFHECLVRELAEATRFKYEVAMVMIDVDFFKKFNDTYGHPLGDIVLKKIADTMKSKIRSYDILSRYGGEEFALILPHTGRDGAKVITEKLRSAVQNMVIYSGDAAKKKKLKVSISAGIASFPDNASNKSLLIKRADKALYLAKEEGRNRVCVSMVTEKDYTRFAFCPPMLSPFYTNVQKGVREVADEIGNVEVETYASPTEESYEKQLALMHQAIDDGVDAIGICSKIDIGPVVARANKAGIKVFIFNFKNVKMNPAGKIEAYIFYDQFVAGKKLASFLARILRGKGSIAILEGLPDEIDSIERKNGALAVFKKFPGITVVASECASWNRKIARAKTSAILQKHPDIDAFIGLSDEMALGAVDSILKERAPGSIFVVGLDGTMRAFESIRDGKLTGTLNTNPVDMGKIMVRAVLKSMFKSDEPSVMIESPTTMIVEENVGNYLA